MLSATNGGRPDTSVPAVTSALSGIAAYLSIDPSLVRIAFVVEVDERIGAHGESKSVIRFIAPAEVKGVALHADVGGDVGEVAGGIISLL